MYPGDKARTVLIISCAQECCPHCRRRDKEWIWVRCLTGGEEALWLRLVPDTGAVVTEPGRAGPACLEELEGLTALEFPRHLSVLPDWVSRLTSLALVNVVRLNAEGNALALEERLAGGGLGAGPAARPRKARRMEGVRVTVSVGSDGAGLRADFVPLANSRANAASLEERLSAVIDVGHGPQPAAAASDLESAVPLPGTRAMALEGRLAADASAELQADLVTLDNPRRNAASLEDRLAAGVGSEGAELQAELVTLDNPAINAAALEDRLAAGAAAAGGTGVQTDPAAAAGPRKSAVAAEFPSIGPEPVPPPSPPSTEP